MDEFQDTRELQYNVIAKLLNKSQIQSMLLEILTKQLWIIRWYTIIEELEMLTSHLFQSKTLHTARPNQRLVDFTLIFRAVSLRDWSRGNNKNDRGFISYDCKATKEDLPNIIIKEKIERAFMILCISSNNWVLCLPRVWVFKERIIRLQFWCYKQNN